jgi:gliding motility-associated-like protein
MKNSIYILLVVAFISSLALNSANAQTVSPNGNKKYRVTAYKIAGTTLTSLSNIAEAVPNPTMYIPSAFTPNGDGINDFFGVKAEGIKQFKMEIYNRWGELVFVTENLLELWDGTYNGERITNTDVFVYQVKAIGKNNNVLPEEKGTVTLIAEGIVE